MAKPLFVWCEKTGLGRNVFVLFRRSFTLAGDPAKTVRAAKLHLFADTRYRLWVNGAVVAYGPARFLPSHPGYDTVDLRPWLKKGKNVLVVEANSFGAFNYEAVPSIGGFIAWGKVQSKDKTIDLATPGEWKMQRAAAWDEDAPAYSFTQAPQEILDTRKLPAEVCDSAYDDRTWAAPVLVERQDAWSQLETRAIPMLTMDLNLPEKVLIHSALAQNEEIIGGKVPGERPDGRVPAQKQDDKVEKVRFYYGMNIYSPSDQDATLGLFWGPHYLNGQEIQAAKLPEKTVGLPRPVWCTALGNRLDYPVQLKAGWNFLYGEPEMLRGQFGLLVGIPAGKGLVASATQDVNGPETMVLSEGVRASVLEAARPGGIPQTFEQFPKLTVPLHRVRRGEIAPLPARMIGWDAPVSKAVAHPSTVQDLSIPAGQDWVVVFDFGQQFLGHVVLDVEAAEGTILDVAYEERLRDDGLAAIYFTNWCIDNADRFITAGGRQRIEGFRPRGGRYLQISIRRSRGPVVLHSVQLRNTVCAMKVEGCFECSDPVLNWTWETGVKTIQITTEDSWGCDAWRERAMYVNDALPIVNAAATFWPDPALYRYCIRLWAHSQSADGKISGVVPRWGERGLGNGSMFWIEHVYEHVQRTGDLDFLREMWPHVVKILVNSNWPAGPRGLLDVGKNPMWFDWGTTPEMTRGENAVSNAHYYAGLSWAEELAGLVKDRALEKEYRTRRARLKQAFQALWDEKANRYAATLIDGQLLQQVAPHANVLALLYGLADGKKAKGALAHVEDYLSDEKYNAPAHLELYWHFWALEALYKYGRVALAEHAMRRTWGFTKNAGAWSLWETFCYGAHHTMQKCQGWGAPPLIAMARRILGVRPTPYRPREVLIAPNSATLTFAKGAVAHPDGPIEVDWRICGDAKNRRLEVAVTAPQAVKIQIAPEGALADLPLRASIHKSSR